MGESTGNDGLPVEEAGQARGLRLQGGGSLGMGIRGWTRELSRVYFLGWSAVKKVCQSMRGVGWPAASV